jgi:hypothetical protein
MSANQNDRATDEVAGAHFRASRRPGHAGGEMPLERVRPVFPIGGTLRYGPSRTAQRRQATFSIVADRVNESNSFHAHIRFCIGAGSGSGAASHDARARSR